jgi:hypothetical protein
MKYGKKAKKTPVELTEFHVGPQQEFKVGANKISIDFRVAYFPEYLGRPPKQTWRKPIVGPPERPFAELQLVQRLEQEGWTAAWAYRPGKFIATWEPKSPALFPRAALELLERIRKRAHAKAGCWDIFAWKKGQPLFIEVKRRNSSDRVRPSQLAWREAAMQEGVARSAFQLIEWCGGSLKGRSVRLTSFVGPDMNAWVECRNGKLTYGGPAPGSIAPMLKHYASWGQMSNASVAGFCEKQDWADLLRLR